ncbi:hypothetical protein AQUCO_02300051v1 [Aquilegia coerulea]|uniref:FBD domain-containing protein n=1 Tax=Aquilegia coerulea TaxID=218851 RepID=A0A2G5DCR1_AQUCA|nr:hypothetical protein AQUCO_02300051v1 [Aquilegia coerulea]
METEMEMDLDKMSHLPEHISERILLCLPVKDAVRTSALSRQWRYRWTTLPIVKYYDNVLIKNDLVRAVDHVLLLHTGQIQTFELYLERTPCFGEIDGWILFLSRNCVRKIILEFQNCDPYKLPSHLFVCDLDYLEEDVLENLISNCPLLNNLILSNISGCSCLNICAPDLRDLNIISKAQDICLTGMTKLASVSISLESLPGDKKIDLIEFLNSLPAIEMLWIKSHFLKYMVMDYFPDITPLVDVPLSYLSVRVDFRDVKEISTTLCLFKCFPHVKAVELLAHKTKKCCEPNTSNWKAMCLMNFTFNQLKHVIFTGFYGFKSELDIINLILSNAPVLETMTIKSRSPDEGLKASKELLKFKRASAQLQIFLDP